MISYGRFCRLAQTSVPALMVIILLITIFGISISPANAQISPGDLSEAHADLEGLRKCNSCHKFGTRGVGPKCLDCHREIAAMREGGVGLHAAQKFAKCTDCHNEHQGRDYQLVFWPDGQKGFRHDDLGYEMTGAHLKLNCRDCHREKNMPHLGQVRAWRKDPQHTFLGLDQKCLSCHQDPHEGSLTGGPQQKTCTSCHDTNQWQPVPKFDHDTSQFPLQGKHRQVTCAKCHKVTGKAVTVGQKTLTVPVFKPQEHTNCTACHEDQHRGNLGPNCTKCHNPGGWLEIDGKDFDHSLTHYPLRGRHAGVSCTQCHINHRKKPAYAVCQDCHRDAHNSQELSRPALIECGDCHTVSGFRPAKYTMDRHDQTEFPLRAAHLATPCFSCHKPLGKGDTKSVYAKAVDLVPTHTECLSCHRDPHFGQTRALTNAAGQKDCLACHREDSWRQPQFDHSQTVFVLQNRHAQVACKSCHKPLRQQGQFALAFKGVSGNCAGCHEDIHQGEFAPRRTVDGQAIDCGGCHVTVDWFAEKFNHDQDSRFALRGGHEHVACAKCHLSRPGDDGKVVIFKPLPIECRDCHGKNPQLPTDKAKGKL